MRNERKRKGFTLLELMIVVVILGVLALLAVPALLNAVGQSREAVVQGNLSAAASSISSRIALDPGAQVDDTFLGQLNDAGENPIDQTAEPYAIATECSADTAGQVLISGADAPFTLRACDAEGAEMEDYTKTIRAASDGTIGY